MRSSCVFSLPTSTHVGSAAAALSGVGAVAAGDTSMSPMSAAFMTVSPAFAASAAFARNVPMPASGITPSSITSVRSRQMVLFAIFFMLFLLLFGFFVFVSPSAAFRRRRGFSARPVMSPNGISGTPCAAKDTVSIVGNVFQRVQSNSAKKLQLCFRLHPFLHLFSFRLPRRSPDTASAESAALSGLTAYASGDDKYKYISVGNII